MCNTVQEVWEHIKQQSSPCQVSQAMFDWFFEILPPRRLYCTMRCADGIVRGVDFVFAEGDGDQWIAFWQDGDQCFACRV